MHCLQRELSNMRNTLEKLHMENRQIMDEQHRKDVQLQTINNKASVFFTSYKST